MEAALFAFKDDLLLFSDEGLLNAGTYRGADGMLQYVGGWEEAWDYMKYEPQEWIEDSGSDAIIVVVRYRGQGRGSGVDIDDRLIWRFEFDGRKIARWGVYADKQKALEAVGLRE